MRESFVIINALLISDCQGISIIVVVIWTMIYDSEESDTEYNLTHFLFFRFLPWIWG